MQIQRSKASRKTVVQMATPSPPAPLPNWPTYCIVSSTTPHQAIDALGMPSRPSTIYTIYAKYSGLPAFFYEIPWNLLLNILWENPLKICSGNILQESLESLKNHKDSPGISTIQPELRHRSWNLWKCKVWRYQLSGSGVTQTDWTVNTDQLQSACHSLVRCYSCTL